jgi:hypothetical protein
MCSIEESAQLQAETAKALLEAQGLHGNENPLNPGDWSIETIGRSIRAKGCSMKMVVPINVADIQRHLDESLGLLIGSGTHWTAIISHQNRPVHLDSNVAAGQPVAAYAPHLRWLSNKALFKIIAHPEEDEYIDAEQRARQAARFEEDWGARADSK